MSEEKNFEIAVEPATAASEPQPAAENNAEGGEMKERQRRPRRRRRSSAKAENGAAEQSAEQAAEQPAAETKPEPQQPKQPKPKQPKQKGRQPIPVLPREVQPALHTTSVRNSVKMAKQERRNEKSPRKGDCKWCGYALQFVVTFVAALAALALWSVVNPFV